MYYIDRCKTVSQTDTSGHYVHRTGWWYQTTIKQDHCFTSVLGLVAAVHWGRHEVGLPVQKASQCALLKREWKEAGEEAASVFEGWRCKRRFPLESIGKQSWTATLLSFLDTGGPAEASTGSRDYNVKDHLKGRQTKIILLLDGFFSVTPNIDEITILLNNRSMFSVLTRHTTTMTIVSLRFFIHIARARLRLVVLNVTD